MSDGGGRAPASCVTCGRVIAGASRIDGVRTEVFASVGAEAHIPDVGEPAIDARFRRFVGLSALPGSILVKWMGLLHGRPPRLIREPQSAHQQRPIAGSARPIEIARMKRSSARSLSIPTFIFTLSHAGRSRATRAAIFASLRRAR